MSGLDIQLIKMSDIVSYIDAEHNHCHYISHRTKRMENIQVHLGCLVLDNLPVHWYITIPFE